jgi:ribosomal protein L4
MLNAYDVLWADKIILTQSALQAMEEGPRNE